MSRLHWSAVEIEKLQELAGDCPFPDLCRQYNLWAGRQGLQGRSDDAIRSACYRQGIATAPVGEWLTARAAGLLLGGSNNLVIHWIRRGWLPARRLRPGRSSPCYVSRSDLRRLARQRPELFAGRSRSTLIQVLCSEPLAEQIAGAFPLHRARQRVQRLDSGQTFPSIRAAAQAAGISSSTLQQALRHKRPAGGCHWRPVQAAA